MGPVVSSSHVVSAAPSFLLSSPALAWAPLSMGPQVLLGACSSMGSPRGRSLLQAHPPALAWGSPRPAGGYLLHCGPPWAAGGYLLHCGPPRAAGDNLLHHGLLHRLQGNLCSGAWSTSSPSFTDLGVCRAISLTHSHSSTLLQFFSPLLKYVITEGLPPPLMGSALASSPVGHGGSFWHLLKAATPAAPPPLLPKPCHTNPVQIYQFPQSISKEKKRGNASVIALSNWQSLCLSLFSIILVPLLSTPSVKKGGLRDWQNFFCEDWWFHWGKRPNKIFISSASHRMLGLVKRSLETIRAQICRFELSHFPLAFVSDS